MSKKSKKNKGKKRKRLANHGKPCVRCGSMFNVTLRVNPFAFEIHDDDTKDYFCDDCVAFLCEEI